jgi:uncharacterized protein (DUF2236 family)
MNTVKDYKLYIQDLASKIEHPEYGFFGPDSIAWRINREGVLGLGALSALLMQVAHPAVAAGVFEHSNFRWQPFSRAYNTLKTQQLIVFGDVSTASQALIRMYARHSQVSGIHGESQSEPYNGNDPQLQFWVLGTLVDTIIRSHGLFLKPMSYEEIVSFYEESKWFAKLMGIREEVLSNTYQDFQAWMYEMVGGKEVVVSDEARDIALSLLQLPLPIFWPVNYLMAAGMLPPRIRDGFGLKWNNHMQTAFDLAACVVRKVTRVLPIRFRTTPDYWQAVARSGISPRE